MIVQAIETTLSFGYKQAQDVNYAYLNKDFKVKTLFGK